MKSNGTSKYRRLSARSLLLYEMAKRRAERSQKLFNRELAIPSASSPRGSEPSLTNDASPIGCENEGAPENN